jgi:UTP--glucose-1-phosphate uridylyltransferase
MKKPKLAVIPCAGLGTRLRPLTWVVPKELLPFGDRPLIQHLLEELAQAGIERVVLVTRKGKEMLRAHLECAGAPANLRLDYVEQEHPRGLGDALLAAREAVAGTPFLMALPDQQLNTASAQLVRHYSGQASLSSMVDIPASEVNLFPGAVGLEITGPGPVYQVKEVLDEARSTSLRAFGRTIFAPEFLDLLPEGGDESDFGRCFQAFLRAGDHSCLKLEGAASDLGTMQGYLHFNRPLVAPGSTAVACDHKL